MPEVSPGGGGVSVTWQQDYNRRVGNMYRKSLARANARTTITRNAHGAVLELHTNGVPKERADWHYDLRRGRLCIYGGLLRFIDVCIASGKPELARKTVQWLSWYVEDQTDPTNTAEIKLEMAS